MRKLTRIQSTDPILNRVQEDVARAVNPLVDGAHTLEQARAEHAARLDAVEVKTSAYVNVLNKIPARYHAGLTIGTSSLRDVTGWVRDAIEDLPPLGGDVVFPPGKFPLAHTVTYPRWGVTFRGAGRRTTFLVPASNAPVLTFSSVSGPMHSHGVSDIGFDNTGTGFDSPAILITGAGINDYIAVERFFAMGFTNAISILGRTIWSRFVDGEILDDAGSAGFYVVTGDVVNHLTVKDVKVGGTLAGDGFHFQNTSPNPFLTITLDHVNAEGCSGWGVNAENADVFSVCNGSYIENNGTGSVRLGGTFARAFSIENSLLWGSPRSVTVESTMATGKIAGNFMAATVATIRVETQSGLSNVEIGANYEAGARAHEIVVDGNGNSHVTQTSGPFGLAFHTVAAGDVVGGVLSAPGENYLRFVNSTPVTVDSLAGDPGQMVHITAHGTGTVTLSHGVGGAGRFWLPGGLPIVLQGTSIALIFDGTQWRPFSDPALKYVNGPVGIHGTQTVYLRENVGRNTDGLGNVGLLVNGGFTDAEGTAIAIKTHGVEGVAGAYKFQSSPDVENYNTAAMQAIGDAFGKIERIDFAFPASNTAAETVAAKVGVDAEGVLLKSPDGNRHRVSVIDGPSLVVEGTLGGFTPEGGLYVWFKNKTGAATVQGTIVQTYDSEDDAVKVAVADSESPIGTVYDAGIADGALCRIVVAGVAPILMKDGEAASRGQVLYCSNVAGRADSALGPPAATLGHSLHAAAGGTNVVTHAVLHFN